MRAPRRHELADEELFAFVSRIRADPPPPAREVGYAALRGDPDPERVREPPMALTRDLVIPGARPEWPAVPARLYLPRPAPLPLVVVFHGGGHALGSIETHDGMARRTAVGADAAVLSVGYRLAPEHPWPACVDDAESAVRWAAEHREELGTAGGTAVAGDSAGATLAALVSLRLRGSSASPDLQALAYPDTDLSLSSASGRTNGVGWGLDHLDTVYFSELWVPDPGMRRDPGVSPLFADPTGVCPAVVVTAEHDVFVDEGDAYAEKVRAAGVAVLHRREPGLLHAFLDHAEWSPASRTAAERFYADLGRLLRAVSAGSR